MRTQASKAEMIDALYKPLEDGKDDGMIRYRVKMWIRLLLIVIIFPTFPRMTRLDDLTWLLTICALCSLLPVLGSQHVNICLGFFFANY